MRLAERILNPSYPDAAYKARLRYDAVNSGIKGSKEQASDDNMGVVRRLLSPPSEPLRMGSAKTLSTDSGKLASKLRIGDRIVGTKGEVYEITDVRHRYKSVIAILRDVKDGTMTEITIPKTSRVDIP